jgi:hypothetical protein
MLTSVDCKPEIEKYLTNAARIEFDVNREPIVFTVTPNEKRIVLCLITIQG